MPLGPLCLLYSSPACPSFLLPLFGQVARETMWEEFNYTLNVSEKTLPGVDKMVTTCGSAMEAATGAHAIAVMTEWDEFATLDYKAIYSVMSKPAFVFDGRNILPHAALREIGFEVYAIGKPEPAGSKRF